MSENASKGADYHRTFEKFSMGMWPIWKHNSMNFNYRGQNYHRREQEDAYAKRVGAFYAHLLTNTGISQKIRIMPKPDQDFSEYATLWEDDYSVLTAIWSQRVEPVVEVRRDQQCPREQLAHTALGYTALGYTALAARSRTSERSLVL